MSLSLLNNFKSENLSVHPFPAIIINNALPSRDIENLQKEIRIADKTINSMDKHQSRFAFTLEDSKINHLESIQRFIELHSSPKFLSNIFEIFSPYLNDHLPNLQKSYNENWSQPAYLIKNPPAKKISYSPRLAHLDNLKDIFAFLFYIRLPEDNTKGGALQLFKYKDRFRGFDRTQIKDNNYIPNKDIELSTEIPYANNTFVCFLDGIRTVHGVTPRETSSFSRFYFTGGAQNSKPVYNPNHYLKSHEIFMDSFGNITQKIRRYISI